MPRATPEAPLDDLAGWIIEAANEQVYWELNRIGPDFWLFPYESMINAVLIALTGEFMEE
jgi:hypothetical protein